MSVKADSFSKLQSSFQSPSFLTYFDKVIPLYINIDTSKKKEFDVIVYHSLKIKSEDLLFDKSSSNTVIKPIIFLSKTLSSTETRY